MLNRGLCHHLQFSSDLTAAISRTSPAKNALPFSNVGTAMQFDGLAISYSETRSNTESR
jgi:hypothetical protein